MPRGFSFARVLFIEPGDGHVSPGFRFQVRAQDEVSPDHFFVLLFFCNRRFVTKNRWLLFAITL